MKKSRLDVLLVERELAESREKAQRIIRAGQVRVNSQPATKPGVTYPDDITVELADLPKYVSRGGDKLEAALDHFKISPKDRVCLDAGASTGGFTDCLLQRGARQVYAVDVGKGQLHWSLRNDARVIVMESVNARYLDPAAFDPRPDLAVIDVSFISLTKVLPAVTNALTDPAELVTLIKPQFEAGREEVGKGGVVRSPAVRDAVVERVRQFGVDELGLEWVGVCASPLRGPAGNVEFLAYWKKP